MESALKGLFLKMSLNITKFGSIWNTHRSRSLLGPGNPQIAAYTFPAPYQCPILLLCQCR